MKSIYNFDWGMYDNDPELRDLIIEEIYERNNYESLYSVKENDIVLDIGASVGPFVASIIDKKPMHVYAVEPSNDSFPCLVKNTRGSNVTPIKKAIYYTDNSTFNSQVWLNKVERSESITFKTLVEQYALDYIDFIKTDCEGGEYYIFTEENMDYLLNNVGVIVGEFHIDGGFAEKFRNFRDNILPRFKRYEIRDCANTADITWDLFNEHFLEYYKQCIIHISNKE